MGCGCIMRCAPRLEQKLEHKQIQTLEWLYKTIFIFEKDVFKATGSSVDYFKVAWLFHERCDTLYGKPFWYHIVTCDSTIEHDKAVKQMRHKAKILMNRINRSDKVEKLVEAFETYNGDFFNSKSEKYFMDKRSYAIRKLVLQDKISYLPRVEGMTDSELFRLAGLE